MTEESGRIYRDPDFHDGHLHGIRVTPDSTLELECTTVDGERYVLSLDGLERLKAENFLEGNIIFEIEVFDSRFPAALVKKAFGLEDHEHPPWIDDKLAQMANESWTLLELSSSYGCDLVAIARGKIRVDPAEKSDD